MELVIPDNITRIVTLPWETLDVLIWIFGIHHQTFHDSGTVCSVQFRTEWDEDRPQVKVVVWLFPLCSLALFDCIIVSLYLWWTFINLTNCLRSNL